MTLPYERTSAVLRMERAVMELAPYVRRAQRGAKHVRVPGEVLVWFYRALKHYPTERDLKESAQRAPQIWGPIV